MKKEEKGPLSSLVYCVPGWGEQWVKTMEWNHYDTSPEEKPSF